MTPSYLVLVINSREQHDNVLHLVMTLEMKVSYGNMHVYNTLSPLQCT